MGGVQNSLQSTLDLMTYVMGIIISNPQVTFLRIWFWLNVEYHWMGACMFNLCFTGICINSKRKLYTSFQSVCDEREREREREREIFISIVVNPLAITQFSDSLVLNFSKNLYHPYYQCLQLCISMQIVSFCKNLCSTNPRT